MTLIKDITEQRYKEITESSYTPIKLRGDWAQKVKEGRATVQLFITKNFDQNIKEYHLLIGISRDSSYLIFNYLCEQAPTFLIDDICRIIDNNIRYHGNNSYLVNQYLNGSGYKNIEHIVMDIFTQEMQNKIGQNDLTETAIQFSDYSYLIQKAIAEVQFALNSIDLKDDVEQSFFFFLLTVEDSIKKLNQEFMFLYFCFYKMVDENLQNHYFQRIDHHIQALKTALASRMEAGSSSNTIVSVSIQLEYLLKNLEFFQKKKAGRVELAVSDITDSADSEKFE